VTCDHASDQVAAHACLSQAKFQGSCDSLGVEDVICSLFVISSELSSDNGGRADTGMLGKLLQASASRAASSFHNEPRFFQRFAFPSAWRQMASRRPVASSCLRQQVEVDENKIVWKHCLENQLATIFNFFGIVKKSPTDCPAKNPEKEDLQRTMGETVAQRTVF
jgi:hypothetical protein